MAKALPNRVREVREARGLSQVALAAAAGLTRQSVHAIEAGRATPAVDVALRVARALDSRVEDLFGAAPAEPRITTEPMAEVSTGRVALSHIAGRWVSYPLDRDGVGKSADGLVGKLRRGRVEVDLLRSSSELRDNVVIMGCAPALGLLADRLNARAGPGRFLWLVRSSTKALEALARSQIHVAGVHLVDASTGEANVPDVRRHARKRAIVLITLASWEAGFVAAAGNPRKIRRASQLADPCVRLVAREPGAGARRLLDRELQRAGLPLELASAARIQAAGHLEVAHAVSIGAADVGIATRDAALAFGLDFEPLAEERYDLAIPIDGLEDPRLVRLLDVMTSGPFRRELASIGYDVRRSGERVADIPAALSGRNGEERR